VKLNSGESKDVTVELDPLFLSIFDTGHHAWLRVPGDYAIMVGGSSDSLPLGEKVSLK
jgi:beta-glucosidase